MQSSNSNQWNFGRFVNTLAYFGAVPVLSSIDWLQQMFGSRSNPTVPPITLSKPSGTILIIGSSPISQEIAQKLQEKGQSVRLISSNDLNSETGQDIKAIVIDSTESFNQTELENFLKKAAPSLRENHEPAIFDFTQPTLDVGEIWGALDDVVMGGVSQSGMRWGPGYAIFTGNVSTANSGGFASVRTRNFEPPLNLSSYDGVKLRVKGDGMRYKFMLRSQNQWDGIAYCYSFDTVADTWITIEVPFQDMLPVFRAKTVPSAGAIAPDQIYSCQFMLSKFEYDGKLNPTFIPGRFTLQIADLRTYHKNSGNQLIWIGAQEQESWLKQFEIPYVMLASNTSNLVEAMIRACF